MKKPLYIALLVVEALSLLLPLYFVLFFEGVLVAALALVAVAAIYAIFGFRAAKQKKAEDEAGLKKTRIFTALVCPVVWVAFIVYFISVCMALGVM